MAVHTHIVIAGLMGVGKTTTAQAVASELNLAHHDSDRDIEALFGLSGAELADAHGVDELHRMESAVLLGRLASDDRSVISAAAWTVEDERCRKALARRAMVVVLDAPIAEIHKRACSSDHRRQMAFAELQALSNHRAPLFEAVSNLTLDATQSTAALAAAVVAQC